MLQAKHHIPKGGKSVLYIRSDGCAKQYKCANALRLVQWLSDIFKITIDWMVTAPHHGKNLVDAIAGRDKYDICNGFIHGMNSGQRDEFMKLLSEADKCCERLNDPTRGMGDTKHKKPSDGTRSLNLREYKVSEYNSKEITAKSCGWIIKDKHWNKAVKEGDKAGGKR